MKSMELLCNLAWVTVAAALWSCWFAGRGRARILPGIALQLVSLAALTAILLPVISITDDLQAANNPAEVERSAVKRDHLVSVLHAHHGAPGARVFVASSFSPDGATRVSLRLTSSTVPAQSSVHPLVLWSRPPPAV